MNMPRIHKARTTAVVFAHSVVKGMKIKIGKEFYPVLDTGKCTSDPHSIHVVLKGYPVTQCYYQSTYVTIEDK